MTALLSDQLISAPERPKLVRQRRYRRWLSLTLIGLVGVACIWFVYQRVVGTLIFEQRQQHLSGSFQAPKPSVVPGDALGVIQIPTLGVNRVIVEGATVDNLRSGPARLERSAMPGEAGVMAVFGHRNAYGGPFLALNNLVIGDSIVVQARNGPIIRYDVVSVQANTAVASVLFEDPQAWSYLALVTSEPGLLNSKQFVVVARSAPINNVAAVVPDLARGPQRAVPLGIDALLFNVALIGAALAWVFLRTRMRSVTAIIIISPIAFVAVVRLLMALDSSLPLTR